MTIVDEVLVIDVDTHVIEPPDLWTSRMSSRFGDMVPHVQWDGKQESWFAGDLSLGPVAGASMAGWPKYFPDQPRVWSEADPSSWDANLRLKKMDDYGIYAQILYGNVGLFQGELLTKIKNTDLSHEIIRAYNDFQSDWSAVAPDRLLPMTAVPFWDLERSLAEISRCASLGHRGIVFSQDPAAFGLPKLTDPHWDPIWALAQEIGLPVNFHIATGGMDVSGLSLDPSAGVRANLAALPVGFFVANARTIAQLTCGGICHRFPQLDFVLVESGIGWIPFALESLDWQWLNGGAHLEHPEYDLLPSEFFRRQIYGAFWFEREVAGHAIEMLGSDNILYETDYPHPTSMSPGPATIAVNPREYMTDVLGGLPADSRRKILHDNASRIYKLDPVGT